jgi:hypothetical protein
MQQTGKEETTGASHPVGYLLHSGIGMVLAGVDFSSLTPVGPLPEALLYLGRVMPG